MGEPKDLVNTPPLPHKKASITDTYNIIHEYTPTTFYFLNLT